jgi:hypothetical protein
MSLSYISNDTFVTTLILALFLIIIISYLFKTKAATILLHTYLGRFLLILIVIYITTYDKMLGLLSILIIILMDNCIGTNNYYQEGFEQINVITPTHTTVTKTNKLNKIKISGIEGKDTIGMEHSIRGKPSNSITADPHLFESDNVSPNEPDKNGFISSQGIM